MESNDYLANIENNTGDDKYKAILKYAWYLRQKDPVESSIQTKKVLQYARENEKPDFEYTALKYLCYSNFYHSDMEETCKWSDELYRTGKKNNNFRAIGTSYSIKSRIALQQNNVSEAMENILQALECFLKINSSNDLMSSYSALGMIHLQRDEDTEAEHYFKLALHEAEKIESHTQHSIRVNISNILYKQNKFKESLSLYLKSLQYFQAHEMDSSMATVLLNIGLCYRCLDDNCSALENLKKSYELCKKINDPRELGLAANAIAYVYIIERDWDNAKKYLEEALKLSEDNNLKINISSCYTTYITYYEMKENFIEANKYLHKLVKIKDEINSENNQKNYAKLEAQYKTQIYRLQNAELDKKNQAMNNQIKELNKTFEHLQQTHQNLQDKFQETLDKLDTQEDLLSSQSRSAMMGEMISAIAHQWKQPLNVIWVLAQAIGEAWEFDELDEEFIKNQLDRIEEQVMYMSDTVNDFRNFFKSDYVYDFNVSRTIDKSIKLVSYVLNLNNIQVIKNLDQNCCLSGNPNELVQVLVNILNNAKEAILRANPAEPLIMIDLSCNNESVTIKISNKGNQIDAEIITKIFKPYFTTRKKEGTGIGLYICQNIIENKFNGKINANNLNDGVEFVITIPVK